MVDVMTDKVVGCVCYDSVHTDKEDSAGFDYLSTGVPTDKGLFCVPVESQKIVEPVGVNECFEAFL